MEQKRDRQMMLSSAAVVVLILVLSIARGMNINQS